MLSIFIKMSANWKKAQASLKEAEKMRVEAELKNLKNQINPHFLLNTLNNVYSLIEFDKEKAQEAIQDLSKMLRYILYNQRDYVSIHEEVGFIMNYVKLMKIRLTDNNEIITDISVSESSTTQVTPLLFISLVENAFKHGISATDKGFIHISISEPESGIISCVISNSYHPKSDSDKSGSGIGLEQVSKRLELMYPNKYIWNNYITDNGATYVSNLTLYK
ncbi:MAG: sensor histidine kinase [Bacteroidales bacterium]|nr:sensor histidine kinase [Bacteroidales bacterium]